MKRFITLGISCIGSIDWIDVGPGPGPGKLAFCFVGVESHGARVCLWCPPTPCTASARAGRFLRFIGGFGLHRASGRRSTNAYKCTPNGTNPIQSNQVEVNVSKSTQGIQFISLGILNWLIWLNWLHYLNWFTINSNNSINSTSATNSISPICFQYLTFFNYIHFVH